METPFHLPADDLDSILDHLPELPRLLAENRLLITGGTGFIGKWLIASILHAAKRYHFTPSVQIITRYRHQHLTDWAAEFSGPIELVEADLHAPLADTLTPDLVIHGAANTRAGLDPLEVGDSIQSGMANLLGGIASQPKVLFLSSGAVYDSIQATAPYKESICPVASPREGSLNYGLAKRQAEYSLVTSHTSSIIARLFAFAGPYLPLDQHFAIGNFIGQCVKKEPIIIKSDGLAVRSYMYPSELVIWLWKLILEADSGSVWNVGSDQPISIRDLADRVAGICGNEIQFVNEGSGTTEHRTWYVPDISKSLQAGLSIRVDLDETIKKTYAWASSRQRTIS